MRENRAGNFYNHGTIPRKVCSAGDVGVKQRFREPVSGLLHLAGAVLAVFGLFWLLHRAAGDPPRVASVVVYGVSLILLFTASSVMHLYNGSRRTIDVLNRLDHAAIYLLTAGTYTPVCVNVLEGGWGAGLLAAVWALAAVGVVYKLVVGPGRRSTTRSTLLYLAMGWLAVVAIPKLIEALPLPALVLIAAGGLAYTIGAIVYLFDDPDVRPTFGLHEIWHLFVLAGSGFHFAAISVFVI